MSAAILPRACACGAAIEYAGIGRRAARCTPCTADRLRDQATRYARGYRSRNRAKTRAYAKRRRKTHRERIARSQAAWRARNADALKLRQYLREEAREADRMRLLRIGFDARRTQVRERPRDPGMRVALELICAGWL